MINSLFSILCMIFLIPILLIVIFLGVIIIFFHESYIFTKMFFKCIKKHNWLISLLISISGVLLTWFVYKATDVIQQNIKNISEKTYDKVVTLSDSLSKKLPDERGFLRANISNFKSIEIYKSLPPLKIYTVKPYASFNCFNFITFIFEREDDRSVLLSNEKSNPVVTIKFLYNKTTGELTLNMDNLCYNFENSQSSYRNYLDYLRFQEALFKNAHLIFLDLEKGSIFMQTDATMPVNMIFDYKKQNKMVILLNNIVIIEDFFQKIFNFTRNIECDSIKKIDYIIKTIKNENINIGQKFLLELNTSEEKEQFLKTLLDLKGLSGISYRYEGHCDIIKLFGEEIDLGMFTIDFPPVLIEPSIESLSKIDNYPIKINFVVKDPSQNIVLYHNTKFSDIFLNKHDL